MDKENSKAFLAFETLDQITLTQEKQFSSDEYLEVVPDCFASVTVKSTLFRADTLLICWDDLLHSFLQSTVESLGLKHQNLKIPHPTTTQHKDCYLAAVKSTDRACLVEKLN